ncbi:MAG: non-canonical purine NTP diphosphatase [Bacteroidaceae bacterium]
MKLVFATNNKHKLEEVSKMMPKNIELLSLADIKCTTDIAETGTTLEENATIKALYIHNEYHLNCFADDTGLEIDALNGAPGVYTARYGAMDTVSNEGVASHDNEANMRRVLRELKSIPLDKRTARFRTVISLFIDGKEHQFEGVVEGYILLGKSGQEGFGYDPIFCPKEYDQSFATLGNDIKNKISHRARAVAKLATYLENLK